MRFPLHWGVRELDFSTIIDYISAMLSTSAESKLSMVIQLFFCDFFYLSIVFTAVCKSYEISSFSFFLQFLLNWGKLRCKILIHLLIIIYNSLFAPILYMGKFTYDTVPDQVVTYRTPSFLRTNLQIERRTFYTINFSDKWENV